MKHFSKVFLAVAVLSSFYGNAFGQSMGYGSCPNVEALEYFEPEKYVGRWYENERIINTFQLGGSCVTADYTAEKDSYGEPTGNILVTNSMTNWRGSKKSISGTAVPLDKSTSDAKYVVIFQGVPTNGSYWVVDTDYKSYSVVYSCTSFWGLFNLKFLWLLTRVPEPSQDVQQKMSSVLKSNGLSSYLLSKTNQKNCQYT
nr:apolipoprotein D-like protein 3 [Nilaparvata lugens]